MTFTSQYSNILFRRTCPKMSLFPGHLPPTGISPPISETPASPSTHKSGWAGDFPKFGPWPGWGRNGWAWPGCDTHGLGRAAGVINVINAIIFTAYHVWHAITNVMTFITWHLRHNALHYWIIMSKIRKTPLRHLSAIFCLSVDKRKDVYDIYDKSWHLWHLWYSRFSVKQKGVNTSNARYKQCYL